MKDIIITAKKRQKEIKLYLLCLASAFGLNLFSIIYYQTEWKELYTQIIWVFIVSFALYFLLLPIRIPLSLIRKRKK